MHALERIGLRVAFGIEEGVARRRLLIGVGGQGRRGEAPARCLIRRIVDLLECRPDPLVERHRLARDVQADQPDGHLPLGLGRRVDDFGNRGLVAVIERMVGGQRRPRCLHLHRADMVAVSLDIALAVGVVPPVRLAFGHGQAATHQRPWRWRSGRTVAQILAGLAGAGQLPGRRGQILRRDEFIFVAIHHDLVIGEITARVGQPVMAAAGLIDVAEVRSAELRGATQHLRGRALGLPRPFDRRGGEDGGRLHIAFPHLRAGIARCAERSGKRLGIGIARIGRVGLPV